LNYTRIVPSRAGAEFTSGSLPLTGT